MEYWQEREKELGDVGAMLDRRTCVVGFPRKPFMRECPRLIARQDHHDQGTVVSVPDHPLPKICMNDRATQIISLPRPSNGLSLLWLTSFLALVAVFLSFLSPLAVLWHQSAKTTASLANFGNELQRFAN